jgi:Flp pilus assembly CpaE family ATPase
MLIEVAAKSRVAEIVNEVAQALSGHEPPKQKSKSNLSGKFSFLRKK